MSSSNERPNSRRPSTREEEPREPPARPGLQNWDRVRDSVVEIAEPTSYVFLERIYQLVHPNSYPQLAARLDYIISVQMFPLNASNIYVPEPRPNNPPPPRTRVSRRNLQQHQQQQHQQHHQQQHFHRPSTTTMPTMPPPGSPATPNPGNLTTDENTYLYHRFPMRQPATAQTVINHFRRMPFLYQDLAEGMRARLVGMPRGRDWDRKMRLATLAQRLATKYTNLKLALPRSQIETIIAKHNGELRPSRFWDKILAEVEKANNAYIITRVWIMLFIVQSTLVALAHTHLPLPTYGQVTLLLGNALAFVWAVTVFTEMLHTRYMEEKADDDELHDIIAGRMF